jgi:hypothetical protein
MRLRGGRRFPLRGRGEIHKKRVQLVERLVVQLHRLDELEHVAGKRQATTADQERGSVE